MTHAQAAPAKVGWFRRHRKASIFGSVFAAIVAAVVVAFAVGLFQGGVTGNARSANDATLTWFSGTATVTAASGATCTATEQGSGKSINGTPSQDMVVSMVDAWPGHADCTFQGRIAALGTGQAVYTGFELVGLPEGWTYQVLSQPACGEPIPTSTGDIKLITFRITVDETAPLGSADQAFTGAAHANPASVFDPAQCN